MSAFTRALATNNYGVSKFIVDGSNPANGTHSTIASALTSASSGDTIFIRPGTYTENLTLKVGVNLVAFEDSFTPNVTIVGTCTLTTAGTVTISGVRLQTNSSALLAVTGSAASIIILNTCYLACTNNTGITFSSSDSGAQILCNNCYGDITTTGISLFTHTSAGSLVLSYCRIQNTGLATTASTASTGTLELRYSSIDFPLDIGASGLLLAEFTEIDTGSIDTTAVTHAGAIASALRNCYIESGTASAISVSTALRSNTTTLNSANANIVTGAGTFTYTGIALSNVAAGGFNVSTQTTRYFGPVVHLAPSGAVIYNTSANAIGTLGTNSISIWEEGTFTPALGNTGSAPTVTYSSQIGRYTRMENRVVCSVRIAISAYTAGTGTVTITDLPFTSVNVTNLQNIAAISLSQVTFDASVLYYNLRIGANTAIADIVGIKSGAATQLLSAANPGASTNLHFTLNYEV